MSATIHFEDFGSLLKFLRKRARLTQRDLAQAVGYTEAHISRLENNERLPDLTTVAALFISALDLKSEPAWMEQLLKLAAQSRNDLQPASIKISRVTIEHEVERELGALEEIPAPPAHNVIRASLMECVSIAIERGQRVALCGMAGLGKTALAASIARDYKSKPVFWHTFIAGVNTNAEAILRQIALFLLANSGSKVRPLVEPRADAPVIPLDQQMILIRGALANQPALLCFDDAHLLMDNETSLSLLRQLSEIESISLLFTSRETIPLAVTQVNLGGLETDEAREFIKLSGLDLEPATLARLLVRTDNNPMLLRLVIGQLLESRGDVNAFIEHLETHPQITSFLLRTILNDLKPSTQWLVQLISVFRQPIDLYDETLGVMIDKSNSNVSINEGLHQLQTRYMIDDAHNASLHPLIKDHLNAALSGNTTLKKQFHRLAAEWSEYVAEDAVEAAYHWACAGDLEQAAETISTESESLFNRGQSPAAVQVVDDVLKRVQRLQGDTTNLRRSLLAARGDLLRGTLRAAEAEASYREALALAHNLPVVRAQIVRNLAQVLMQRSQSAEALRLCQSAIDELSPTDVVLIARLLSIECRAHLMLSHFDEAEKTSNHAIELANQFSEFLPKIADDVRARAERTLGWVNYTRHPKGDESLIHYRRALECARRAELKAIENAVLSNTATAWMERGDWDLARETYLEALQGFESMGDMHGVAGILHNLGALHTNREEPEMALNYFERASEIEWRIGDTEGWLSTEQACSSILLSMGRVAEARSILDNAVREGKESTDTWTLGSCLCSLIEVELLQGELEEARLSAQRVLSMTGIEENARIRAWALSGLALVQCAAGEIETAQHTIADHPEKDLGLELAFRWQLVQCAVAVASGNLSTAQMIAKSVIDIAKGQDFQHIIFIAENLITNINSSFESLLRLILT